MICLAIGRRFSTVRHTETGYHTAIVRCIAIGLGCLWLSTAALAQNPVLTIDNEFLNDTRLTSGLLVSGPPEVAREMAIIGSAMFDAANAASGLTYPSVAYVGGAVSGVSVDAAALTAGYTALRGIFANSIWAVTPGGSATLQTTVLNSIDATYATALATLGVTNVGTQCPGLTSVCGGISLGTSAGNDNLSARGYTVGNNVPHATDGSATSILLGISNPYTAGPNPPAGKYIPPNEVVPPGRVAMFPTWGSVAPSGLSPAQLTAAEATVPGPPAITSAAYAQSVLRTECGGNGRALSATIKAACASAGIGLETTAQARAALFWNDPGTTYQPPGHWLDIADSLIQSQPALQSTLQAARLASLVGQAENDAGIAAWDVKYKYLLWRPITAIQDCNSWNASFDTCDATWVSLIATPPHPDYVAGHPAFSGAAATIITADLGSLGVGDVPVTSVSDTYCNANSSTPLRSATTQLIVACTVPAGPSMFAYKGGNTIYSTPTGCVDVGGVPGVNGPLNTCALTTVVASDLACTSAGGTPTDIGPQITCTIVYNYSPVQSGCNDIVNGAPNAIVPDGANDSPLICPITETFPTVTDASSGENGAEFSRVVGGIHTDFSVEDALDLGNLLGQTLAAENNIPEPGTLSMLMLSVGLLTRLRRQRTARARSRRAPRVFRDRIGMTAENR